MILKDLPEPRRRLHDTGVTGEKSLMTSVERSSCRTQTPQDKSTTDILLFLIGCSRKMFFFFYCDPQCSLDISYLCKEHDDDDDDDGGTHLFSHSPGDCRGGQRAKHTASP